MVKQTAPANTVPTYSVTDFTYTDGKFVTELSTLNLLARDQPPEEFGLFNPVTGRRIVFSIARATHDQEMEITAWVYKAKVRNGIEERTLTATLIND